MIGHYKRSKYLAEQEALAAAKDGQQVMILNPTSPIGTNDVKPTPTGQIIVDFLNRRFPAYMDTGLNLVDVREVARAHVSAVDKGRPGERYILGGENLTLKQILDKMSAITGLPSPTMRVPHAVAMAFAYYDELVTGRLRGKEPRATVESVRMGRRKCTRRRRRRSRNLVSACCRFTTHCERPLTGSASTTTRQNSCIHLMRRIGIIAALAGELKPLVQGWERTALPEGCSYSVTKNGLESVAVYCGMGQGSSGAGLHAGAGGRTAGGIHLNWLGRRVDFFATGGTVLSRDGSCGCFDGERYQATGEGTPPVRLVTARRVALKAEKRQLADDFGAMLVDMEAATVARLARVRDIPFYCYKAVSDSVDEALPDMNPYISPRGAMRTKKFVAAVMVKPKHWPGPGPHGIRTVVLVRRPWPMM